MYLPKLFNDRFGPWKAVAKCDGDDHSSGNVYVRGKVYYRRFGIWRKAGTFTRRVNTYDGMIYHSNFYMDEKYRNRGFAKVWINNCFARYRAAGIDRVEVSTATDGGFVWARMGFLPASLENVTHLIRFLRDRAPHRENDYITPMTETAWESFQPFLAPGEDLYLTSANVVSEGRVADMWNQASRLLSQEGQPIMYGLGWEGVLPLNDEAYTKWDQKIRTAAEEQLANAKAA